MGSERKRDKRKRRLAVRRGKEKCSGCVTMGLEKVAYVLLSGDKVAIAKLRLCPMCREALNRAVNKTLVKGADD